MYVGRGAEADQQAAKQIIAARRSTGVTAQVLLRPVRVDCSTFGELIVHARVVLDRIQDRTGPAAIKEIRPGSVCSRKLSTHL